VQPEVVDVFDAAALMKAVVAARPDIVIHQLTDLPKDLNPGEMAAGRIRNAHIRTEGTRNLVAAALEAGARRLVSQSIAWVYAAGTEPHAESDAVSPEQTGVIALEDFTLRSPPLEGIVLRYGQLYGPGTHTATPLGPVPVHVDAAAHAALLAIDHGAPGIYNVAQPNAYAMTTKASTELGWNADFRIAD
jgi:nucleoside-diphosphate-sugar epimerase